MTGPEGKKPCRRCLIADIPDEAALRQIIRERIALVPEDERATPETYRGRMDTCRGCARLNRGTCALCGCYVEIRGAWKQARCPDVPDRWAEMFPMND